MDLMLVLTLLAVLVGVPGAIIAAIQIREWLRKREEKDLLYGVRGSDSPGEVPCDRRS